jgi:hypothetical protein
MNLLTTRKCKRITTSKDKDSDRSTNSQRQIDKFVVKENIAVAEVVGNDTELSDLSSAHSNENIPVAEFAGNHDELSDSSSVESNILEKRSDKNITIHLRKKSAATKRQSPAIANTKKKLQTPRKTGKGGDESQKTKTHVPILFQKKVKRDSVRLREFVLGLVYGNAAVCLRALGGSLKEVHLKSGKLTTCLNTGDKVMDDLCFADTDNGKAVMCRPLPYRSIGSKNQLHPNPSPNKILDFGCSTMRLEILRRFESKNERCPLSDGEMIAPKETTSGKYHEDFFQDCFRSLLLTFLGRPGLLGNYTRHNCTGVTNPYIPGCNEIDLFIEHINDVDEGGSPATRLLQMQWKQPKSLRNAIKLKQFLKTYADAHSQNFRRDVLDYEYPSNSNKSFRRLFKDKWVEFILEECQQTSDDDIAKWHFQVNNAISTLESVYGLFLGEWSRDSVIMGPVALEGWKLLQASGQITGSKAFKKINGMTMVHMSDVMEDEHAEQILSYLKNDISDKERKILLMDLANENGETYLKNCVSGQRIDYIDIKHWLCKLHLYMKVHTFGHEVAKYPRSHAPHCRPFITHDKRLCLTKDQRLYDATVAARQTFWEIAGTGLTFRDVIEPPPDVYLVEDEISLLLEAFCST